MFRMNKNVMIQENDKVLARVEAIAFDQRTKEQVNLIVYIELTAEEQDAKPIVERGLKSMGYSYLGITNVETTSVPFDAEGMFLYGKEQEQKDLYRN